MDFHWRDCVIAAVPASISADTGEAMISKSEARTARTDFMAKMIIGFSNSPIELENFRHRRELAEKLEMTVPWQPVAEMQADAPLRDH